MPAPVLIYRYAFDQPCLFAECRAQFGPTFTLRFPGFPPVVVTRDRDAIKRLFTGDPLTKRHGNDLLRPFVGDRSVMVLEPADHVARRRLELPSFHGERVRAYSERIRELAQAELSGWRAGDVVAVDTPARAVTLSVILELVLGVRDRALGTELAKLFDFFFDQPLQNLGQFMPPWVTRRSRWNLLGRVAYAKLDRLEALLTQHIARTRTDPALERRDDVLALLVLARSSDGPRLTDVDLRDELKTLVAAGHETTATAIAWAADLLAHHPGIATRLRETLAAGDRDYLKATAKEVLRVRTIAYASAARHPLQPVQVGEWIIGADTTILVDAQGIHGDPKLYPQPNAFKPERFLDKQPDGYAYVPFGGGAHRCLGAALATMELELLIETIVTSVKLGPAGPPAAAKRRGLTLAPDGGAKVRIAARL